MKTIRIILILSVAILLVTIATIGTVSLWPWLPIIGKALLAFLILLVGCGCLLALKATSWAWVAMSANAYRRVQHSRLLIAGEVVVLQSLDGTVLHLSAMHRAAGVSIDEVEEEQKQIGAPSSDEGDDLTVLNLFEKGLSLRAIVKATGRSYYDVQRMTAAWKKKLAGKAD